jgi:hypothetical protein
MTSLERLRRLFGVPKVKIWSQISNKMPCFSVALVAGGANKPNGIARAIVESLLPRAAARAYAAARPRRYKVVAVALTDLKAMANMSFESPWCYPQRKQKPDARPRRRPSKMLTARYPRFNSAALHPWRLLFQVEKRRGTRQSIAQWNSIPTRLPALSISRLVVRTLPPKLRLIPRRKRCIVT